jgi:phage baseplate assembly protein W
MKGYSVQVPLKYDAGDGFYKMNKDLREVIKQNLKMLILTNPGERIMNTDYGVGAKRLLFFNRKESVSEIDMERIIRNQIQKYMPYIIIQDIDITDILPQEQNAVFISISYSVPSLKERDSIELILNPD